MAFDAEKQQQATRAGSTNKLVEAVTDAPYPSEKPHVYRSYPFHCADRRRCVPARDRFAVAAPDRFFAGIIVSQEEYA